MLSPGWLTQLSQLWGGKSVRAGLWGAASCTPLLLQARYHNNPASSSLAGHTMLTAAWWRQQGSVLPLPDHSLSLPPRAPRIPASKRAHRLGQLRGAVILPMPSGSLFLLSLPPAA
jgi:hypothetical protein